MARSSDPQQPTTHAAADREPATAGRTGAPRSASPVDRFLASSPSAPRAVERRADARTSMLGGRAARTAGVVVREAGELDDPALVRLADRDGGRIPGPPVLVAEVEGAAVAAIGVLDRRVLADPGVDTDGAVDRLQAVAAELRGPERRRRWAARLRRTGRRTPTGATGDGLPGAAR